MFFFHLYYLYICPCPLTVSLAPVVLPLILSLPPGRRRWVDVFPSQPPQAHWDESSDLYSASRGSHVHPRSSEPGSSLQTAERWASRPNRSRDVTHSISISVGWCRTVYSVCLLAPVRYSSSASQPVVLHYSVPPLVLPPADWSSPPNAVSHQTVPIYNENDIMMSKAALRQCNIVKLYKWNLIEFTTNWLKKNL